MNLREQILEAVRGGLAEFGFAGNADAEHIVQRITVRVLKVIYDWLRGTV